MSEVKKTQEYLQRIQLENPKINAILHVNNSIVEEAKALEKKEKRGKKGKKRIKRKKREKMEK